MLYNSFGGLIKIRKRRPRLNQQIRAPKVRVIDQDGKQIGVLTLSEALEKAREQGLDLIEVAPQTDPPVVRILDFKKYQFEKKQQEKKSKKKTTTLEVKELRFGPNIGPNDLQIRIERAREFLGEGDKVKITIQFKGRQISHPEIGFDKIKKIVQALSDVARVEREPERKGRFIHTVLGPK